jgi:hypothetical protein
MRKTMDVSITAKNRKQNRQKPPRSMRRFACEFLAGVATGFTAAMPVTYVIGARYGQEGCFGGGWTALGYFFLIVPPVYGLCSGIGAYLAGNVGKQTGSLLLALGSGFVGGLAMYVILPLSFWLLSLKGATQDIILWSLWVFALFIPPTLATLGFNLTRRYKEPPSS